MNEGFQEWNIAEHQIYSNMNSSLQCLAEGISRRLEDEDWEGMGKAPLVVSGYIQGLVVAPGIVRCDAA